MTKKIFITLNIVAILLFIGGCEKQQRAKVVPTRPNSNMQLALNSDNDIENTLSKVTKDMTFEEANKAKEHYQKNNNNEMVAKCAVRMLAVGGDQEIMKNTTLQLAQLYLEEKNYEKAEKYALDFQTLYPGSNEAKQAGFIAIKANFLSSPESNRDQTNTEKTIELAQNFLSKYPNTEFSGSINSMMKTCYEKLLDREVAVINSYMQKYDYYKSNGALLAAHKRLAYIKEKIMPKIKEKEQMILALEKTINASGTLNLQKGDQMVAIPKLAQNENKDSANKF